MFLHGVKSVSHPLGPWAESRNDASVYGYFGAGLSRSGKPFIKYQSQTGANFWSKTGVNNGRQLTYTPSNASLEKIETRWDGTGGCSGRYTYLGQKIDFSFVGPTRYATGYLGVGYDTSLLNSSRNNAYAKLSKKVNAAVLQAGVSGGEFKETVRTLKSGTDAILSRGKTATQSLGRVYSNLRSGRLALAAEQLSDAFLEFQFGVKPIITDIGHAMDAIAQKGNSRSLKKRISSTFVESKAFGSVVDDWAFPYNGDIKIAQKARIYGKYEALVKIGGTLDFSLNPTVPVEDPYGISFDQVGPTIYELIPYSWLLDYITNINQFVGAAAFRRGVIVNGWKVEIEKSVSTAHLDYYVQSGVVAGFRQTPDTVKHARFRFNRSPFVVDSYVPSLEFKVPNLEQSANIAALFINRFSKLGVKAAKLAHGADEKAVGELTLLAKQRIFR